MIDNQLIEKLAAIEHERWADWQRYLHSKLEPTPHGWIMLGKDYDHWSRQIDTPYDELSEAEKDSDREQTARYFPLIQRAVLEARIGELQQSQHKDYAPEIRLKYLEQQLKELEDNK
jgi:hypothetical protein